MRRVLPIVLALAILAGCSYVPEHVTPPPVPLPDNPVTQAASGAMDAYRKAMADEAEATADKAKGYAGWDEAFGDWKIRNQKAREAAFQPYTDALDAAVLPKGPDGKPNPDAPYDAAALETQARHAAKGLRGK
jgi:hypothetical protein